MEPAKPADERAQREGSEVTAAGRAAFAETVKVAQGLGLSPLLDTFIGSWDCL